MDRSIQHSLQEIITAQKLQVANKEQQNLSQVCLQMYIFLHNLGFNITYVSINGDMYHFSRNSYLHTETLPESNYLPS
jgi:hypothetical protein